MTSEEERKVVKMSMHFPSLARGHGSQHQEISVGEGDEVHVIGQRCNIVGCHPTEIKHRQNKYELALAYFNATHR